LHERDAIVSLRAVSGCAARRHAQGRLTIDTAGGETAPLTPASSRRRQRPNDGKPSRVASRSMWSLKSSSVFASPAQALIREGPRRRCDSLAGTGASCPGRRLHLAPRSIRAGSSRRTPNPACATRGASGRSLVTRHPC